MFPAVIEATSTCWSANGTSNLVILSLHITKSHYSNNFDLYVVYEVHSGLYYCSEYCVRAVPVDVVDSRLWFQCTRVNSEKHHRAALLLMDNLEGQSTQVVLVPAPVESWIKQTINSLHVYKHSNQESDFFKVKNVQNSVHLNLNPVLNLVCD